LIRRDSRFPAGVCGRKKGFGSAREAAEFLPESPAIPTETARIYWTVLDDPEKAREYYREACGKPHASALYARLRAVILVDLGRDREDLAWLQEVLDGLDPATSPGLYALMMEYVKELRAGWNPRAPMIPTKRLSQLIVSYTERTKSEERPSVTLR